MIHPGNLGQESAATLARKRLGIEPDAVFAAALQTGSGGNPLYLAAMLDALWREGTAPTAERSTRVLELGPQAVSRGVATRLARLDADAAGLLRAAAILGDQTELALAAALAGLEPKVALTAASALVSVDLLRHENPLEFTHPVVRTAVLEDMSAHERTAAHRRAAKTLLERGALPEQAATYLLRAVPAGDSFVVDTLRQAAERSIADGAPEAAAAYLRRALDEPPEREERSDILGDLGLAEAHGDVSGAAVHLRECLDDLSAVALRPDVVLSYARTLTVVGGRVREAAALLQRLSDAVGDDNPELRERIAAFLIVTCQFDPALEPILVEQWARVRAQELQHGLSSGLLLGVCSIEEARRGTSLDKAVAFGRRALSSDLIEMPDRFELVNPLAALAMAGEVAEALAGFERVIAVARRRGDQLAAQTQGLWRGLVLYEAGELLLAEQDLAVIEATPFWGLPTPLAYRAGFLAQVLLERGKTADAEKLVAAVSLDEIQIGHQIQFLYGRGRLRSQTGAIADAVHDFLAAGEVSESITIPNPAFTHWRSEAALALRQLGRDDEARQLANQELELSRRWGAARTVGVSLRALALLEGGKAGEAQLREALELLATSPARLEHARALVDLGALLRRGNSRSEARQLLREGVELALRCGATALVERANSELAATGAHPRTILFSGLDALTASERRVAQMAAEDLSNKEIAQALFVTVKTVEQHLGRVYRKLDISSRSELGAALAAPA